MTEKESLKNRIKVVKKEMEREPSKTKKARLNKYKQKLEIRLRDVSRKEHL